jgi:membrane-bound lytic murein transglycosylase D
MNKLLLLATSLISLTIQSRGATHPSKEVVNKIYFNDSTAKSQNTDPKLGFKNLFETANVDGVNTTRLNPKAISFVEDYMEDNTDRLVSMKSWGRPYFDMINTVLTKHGLPVEMKYLSVIESDLKSGATSWAGAVGPWQLMPETARLLGLVVNRKRDDRRDYVKSTNAAARYLTNLYNEYGDWLLVIAAYNCGPGNVNKAIKRSGSRNFWDMQHYLPTETRNHVKKFIATHYIMEGAGGLTTLTKKETESLLGISTSLPAPDSLVTVVNVSGKYVSSVIANNLQMSITDFNSLNPNFDKVISSKGSYDLRVPNERLEMFHGNKSMILEQSVQHMFNTAMRTK